MAISFLYIAYTIVFDSEYYDEYEEKGSDRQNSRTDHTP